LGESTVREEGVPVLTDGVAVLLEQLLPVRSEWKAREEGEQLSLAVPRRLVHSGCLWVVIGGSPERSYSVVQLSAYPRS
jgi:hypothetical protein